MVVKLMSYQVIGNLVFLIHLTFNIS